MLVVSIGQNNVTMVTFRMHCLADIRQSLQGWNHPGKLLPGQDGIVRVNIFQQLAFFQGHLQSVNNKPRKQQAT